VGLTVNKVAEWLRERGFNAHAGPASGGDVNYIPVAIDAGLGVAGKHGLLMTRNNGPRVYWEIQSQFPIFPLGLKSQWQSVLSDMH
jgi:hypothetical protein